MSVECLCDSCRTAGERLQTLPGAPQIVDDKGATRFVIQRKDRVRVVAGAEHLRAHRLSPQSHTRRVVATCCNTAAFLEFESGHWLSLYGALWPPNDLPALQLRTMVGDRVEGGQLPRDVPNAKTHNLAFYGRLLGAWAAMGFRTPKLDYVEGMLDA